MQKSILKVGLFLLLLLFGSFFSINVSLATTIDPSKLLNLYTDGKIIDTIDIGINEILIAYKGNPKKQSEDEEIIADDLIKTKNGFKIYSGSFYTDEGLQTYEIEYATTTITMFDSIVNNEQLGLNLPGFFKILSARAQATSSTFAHAGDGRVIYTGSSDWPTTHNALSGTGVSNNGGDSYVRTSFPNPNYAVYRLFYPFELSIAGDYSVDNASLNLFNLNDTSDANSDAICLVEGTPADYTSLTTADYDAFNSTLLTATCTPIADLTGNAYNSYDLIEDGINLIDLNGVTIFTVLTLRDFYNYIPTGENHVDYAFTEQAGTDKDPYLYIEYSTSTTTSTTTTVYALSCTPDDPDDLSLVGACSYYSTSTGVTYTNYRIRFLIYLVLLVPMLWVFNIFINKYERRILKCRK